MHGLGAGKPLSFFEYLLVAIAAQGYLVSDYPLLLGFLPPILWVNFVFTKQLVNSSRRPVERLKTACLLVSFNITCFIFPLYLYLIISRYTS